MLLIKDNMSIELTNEVQIAAYKHMGWTESQPKKKNEDKKGKDE